MPYLQISTIWNILPYVIARSLNINCITIFFVYFNVPGMFNASGRAGDTFSWQPHLHRCHERISIFSENKSMKNSLKIT